MLRQQISGVVNLSIPLIILYNLYPVLLVTLPGQIFCSLMLGAYIYYLNYLQLKNLENTLQYGPTDRHKELFHNLIQECGVDSDSIVLKYAYTNESIAMTAGTTIIIDPVVWHDIDADPQAVLVQDIFKTHIESGLTSAQKERIAAFKSMLTPQAQRFIFKHELAHVMHNYSYEKLIVVFIIGALAAYSGIIAAVFALQVHGLVAIIAGMFVGGSMDLFLTYLSNFVWKLQEEKAADAFAVQHSSHEDIQAAALFFENHQDILDRHKDSSNYLSYVSSTIMTGHQRGADRSAYILRLMSKK